MVANKGECWAKIGNVHKETEFRKNFY